MEQQNTDLDIDVAVVGGGPAGLQAALVLARTRKRVVVFDDPAPPRNAASHGIHNFVGVEGLKPHEFRDRAWSEISAYGSARLVESRVDHIEHHPGSGRFALLAGDERYTARDVILATGAVDRPPELDGFSACWGRTIIPCPFCDGFEHRDRRWGIVASTAEMLDAFPGMVRNWTEDRSVIVPRRLEVGDEQRARLDGLGVELYRGDVVAIEHDGGEIRAVTLDGGERIEVDTLLWALDQVPTPLVARLADTTDLELDDQGHVVVDDAQRTAVPGLWAAGDVQGWMGAIGSANLGGMAAAMLVHDWYPSEAA